MQSFMSVMCRASSHFLDSLSLSLTLQVVVLYSLLLASSSSFSLELLPFSTHTETGVLSSWPLLLLPTNGQKKRNLSAAVQPSMPVVSCLPRGGEGGVVTFTSSRQLIGPILFGVCVALPTSPLSCSSGETLSFRLAERKFFF